MTTDVLAFGCVQIALAVSMAALGVAVKRACCQGYRELRILWVRLLLARDLQRTQRRLNERYREMFSQLR